MTKSNTTAETTTTKEPNSTGTNTSQSENGHEFKEWALIELFGHQRLVGLCSESNLGGGAFIRVDIPAFNKKPAFTQLLNPKSIYRITPVSEETAKALLVNCRQEPIQSYEIPRITEGHPEEEDL